jgi:hypothetical protein
MNATIAFDFTFVKCLHDRFKHILYEDKKHVYYNLNTKKQLGSVTGLIKKFKKPFDREYWLKVKSEQRGITKDQLAKEWNDSKDSGLSIGNIYHDYIQKRNNREWVLPKKLDVEAYLSSHNDITIFAEFVIGNDVIGGKFDNLSLRDDDLILKDWKSNKKFDLQSDYYLINGLEHIPACEFYEYALQTSLYQYILDLPIVEREIVWFDRTGEFHVFKTPYLEDEVKHMLSFK